MIDVTRMFTNEVPEFSGRARVRSRTFDASRSFVERAVSFPDNIEVEATHTYSTGVEIQGPVTTPQAALNAARPGSASVVMHFSMVKLPDNPMMPRVFDERVGYFSVQQVDYGREEHRAQRRRYITRWRLEKKDPGAALSEPVKPIVFYIDPATPTMLVPFVKRGIESWKTAFEEAGFRNAIIAKDAPTKEQDPDWSAEDARYSVIRWLPSTTENAFGPHISDPRTGEILEADIQMHHNVMNLLRSLVLRAGGAARSARRAAAAARRSHGPARRIRHRARSRALPRVPAQHESELDVSRRESARPRVGEEDGPHADADGLLALQLRRAARGPHRSSGSHSADRPLRPLGDDVGLQADSGRDGRRR